MTVMARPRPRRRRAGALVVLALVGALAACSDDNGDDGGGTTTTDAAAAAPHVPDDLGRGCGDQAVTDPTDLSAGRVLARCASGAPEPEPLATPTTLRVAVPDSLTEDLAPLLVARAKGEFEEEGLTVELTPLGDREAYDALAAGEVDLVVGPLNAPFFDSLKGGERNRLILGGTVASAPNDNEQGQTGFWVRDSALAGHGLSDLEQQPVGMPDGVRSSATYPVGLVFTQTDITLNEVALTDVGGPAAAERLVEGELAAAWLDGGSWRTVAGQPGFYLAGTLPASEAIDGTVASPALVGPDRAAGLAYTRAVIRTINTYLTGDYRGDPEVMGTLSEATEIPVEDLAGLPPLLFDWEVRDGTVERIQDELLLLGGVSYDEPVAAENAVDRSLAADAVGAGA